METVQLGRNFLVIFSKVEGHPSWRAEHWRAELYDDEGGGWLSHPVGIAYVSICELLGPVVDYFTIFEHHRGQGNAMRLMRAVHARWPDVSHTERIRDEILR